MATIDYKEKYEQALEKARQLCAYPTTKPFISDLQDIFPELKESEDERIRKALKEYFINSFQNNGVAAICGVHIKDILAFLEKQGKTSPILYNSSKIGKNEQKSVDKIEPKFKVGNKIKLAIEPKYPAREIIAIQNDAYYFDEAIYLPFSRQDEWELVEQKPAETEKGTKGNNGEIPNSTWSEEDEKIFSDIIKDLVHPWNEYIPDRIEDEIKWLKNKLNSLRPQKQWKPSDEQMYNLSEAAHCDCVFLTWKF